MAAGAGLPESWRDGPRDGLGFLCEDWSLTSQSCQPELPAGGKREAQSQDIGTAFDPAMSHGMYMPTQGLISASLTQLNCKASLAPLLGKALH
jgi:hypothetical protein